MGHERRAAPEVKELESNLEGNAEPGKTFEWPRAMD